MLLRNTLPQQQLYTKLNTLRLEGSFCDVQLTAEQGNATHVHSCVVASQSALLYELLKLNNKVQLQFLSQHQLNICVRYMYGQEVEINNDLVTSLHNAAVMLKMDHLQDDLKAFNTTTGSNDVVDMYEGNSVKQGDEFQLDISEHHVNQSSFAVPQVETPNTQFSGSGTQCSVTMGRNQSLFSKKMEWINPSESTPMSSLNTSFGGNLSLGENISSLSTDGNLTPSSKSSSAGKYYVRKLSSGGNLSNLWKFVAGGNIATPGKLVPVGNLSSIVKFSSGGTLSSSGNLSTGGKVVHARKSLVGNISSSVETTNAPRLSTTTVQQQFEECQQNIQLEVSDLTYDPDNSSSLLSSEILNEQIEADLFVNDSKPSVSSDAMKVRKVSAKKALAAKGGRGKMYKCHDCGLEFDSHYPWWKHRSLQHTKKHVCKYCGHVFTHNDLLKVHIRRHEKKFRLFCDKCDFRCMFPVDLLEHNEAKHEHSPREYKCKHCPEILPSHRYLVNHERFHFSRYVCRDCGYITLMRSKYIQHRQSLHNPSDMYQCSACDQKFKNKARVKDHELKVHGIHGRDHQVVKEGAVDPENDPTIDDDRQVFTEPQPIPETIRRGKFRAKPQPKASSSALRANLTKMTKTQASGESQSESESIENETGGDREGAKESDKRDIKGEAKGKKETIFVMSSTERKLSALEVSKMLSSGKFSATLVEKKDASGKAINVVYVDDIIKDSTLSK